MSDILKSVNSNIEMPSLSPAFQRTVAERMAAYQERIAERIRQELERKGEQPADLAYRLGINPRQPRHFRALAEHFDVEVADLKPDLEEEERQLQAQLNRIEQTLDKLLKEVRGEEPPAADDVPVTLPQAPDRRPAVQDADAPPSDEEERQQPGG